MSLRAVASVTALAAALTLAAAVLLFIGCLPLSLLMRDEESDVWYPACADQATVEFPLHAGHFGRGRTYELLVFWPEGLASADVRLSVLAGHAHAAPLLDATWRMGPQREPARAVLRSRWRGKSKPSPPHRRVRHGPTALLGSAAGDHVTSVWPRGFHADAPFALHSSARAAQCGDATRGCLARLSVGFAREALGGALESDALGAADAPGAPRLRIELRALGGRVASRTWLGWGPDAPHALCIAAAFFAPDWATRWAYALQAGMAGRSLRLAALAAVLAGVCACARWRTRSPERQTADAAPHLAPAHVWLAAYDGEGGAAVRAPDSVADTGLLRWDARLPLATALGKRPGAGVTHALLRDCRLGECLALAETLRNVVFLDIAHNAVRSLAPLGAGLPHLVALDATANALAGPCDLRGAHQLRWARLAHNALTELAADMAPRLLLLDVSHNLLTSVDALAAGCRQLRALVADHNPHLQLFDLARTVRRLPALHALTARGTRRGRWHWLHAELIEFELRHGTAVL